VKEKESLKTTKIGSKNYDCPQQEEEGVLDCKDRLPRGGKNVVAERTVFPPPTEEPHVDKV